MTTTRFTWTPKGELNKAVNKAIDNGAAVVEEQPATINTHEFDSTGDAYDDCQCCDELRDGDALVIANECVVGIVDTWPVAVTAAHGELHTADPGSEAWQAYAAKMRPHLLNAIRIARARGYELAAWAEELAR